MDAAFLHGVTKCNFSCWSYCLIWCMLSLSLFLYIYIWLLKSWACVPVMYLPLFLWLSVYSYPLSLLWLSVPPTCSHFCRELVNLSAGTGIHNLSDPWCWTEGHLEQQYGQAFWFRGYHCPLNSAAPNLKETQHVKKLWLQWGMGDRYITMGHVTLCNGEYFDVLVGREHIRLVRYFNKRMVSEGNEESLHRW